MNPIYEVKEAKISPGDEDPFLCGRRFYRARQKQHTLLSPKSDDRTVAREITHTHTHTSSAARMLLMIRGERK